MPRRKEILAGLGHATNPTLVVDFDGTMSPIVERPETARPVAGAVDALNALAARGVEVAVLSGRPISFLQQALVGLSERVRLIGHSGLERLTNGTVMVEPEAESWLPAVRAAHRQAVELADDRLVIEDKRLSFSIHYRGAADLEDAARSLADRVGTGGLSPERGKMHVEIRPPVSIDKGTALRTIVAEATDWALYAGDDVVDVPAFAALRSISAGSAFCVAVGTAESPSALLDAADLVVSGPREMVELVEAMVEARASDVR